ncbi:hypothetical protein FQR65_LT09813 [Abscondita terminalis]|nr:hypothetical protein FQR65_LT09813 [Abscondita terminalis]
MTTTDKIKRNRDNNFTKEEELLFLTEIEKYKNIIECKMTDKINSSEKNDAWRKIQIGFNSNNGSHRNLEQLKNKYDNLKCKARKVVAENKNYIRGRGGGPAVDIVLDPIIEAVLRIIHKVSVVGLPSQFDCDKPMNVPTFDSGERSSQQMESVGEDEIFGENTEEVLHIAPKCDVPKKENVKQTTWSKYTPKKLKTPMSRRLREVANSPIKEAYYKKN